MRGSRNQPAWMLAAAVSVCSLVAPCRADAEAGGASPAPTRINVLQKLGIPAFAAPTVLATMRSRGAAWKVEVTVTDAAGRPAAARKLTLRWPGGQTALTTSRQGRAWFELTKDRLGGPVLEVPAGLKADFGGKGTPQVIVKAQTSMGPGGGRAESLDLSKLKKLSTPGQEVYYPEKHAAVAPLVLAELARMRGFARAAWDLELLPAFAVAVVDDGNVQLNIVGALVIPVPASTWADGRRSAWRGTSVWIALHEWVELTLVMTGKAFYARNPNTRFIGDGLAELMCYEYCRRYYPAAAAATLAEYRRRLGRLVQQKITEYDLAKDFVSHSQTLISPGGAGSPPAKGDPPAGTRRQVRPEMSGREDAGYPMSFWFWYSLRKHGGPEALRKVVAWLGQARDVSLETTLEKVRQVSGRDAKAKMDVPEALDGIRSLLKAGHTPGPHPPTR